MKAPGSVQRGLHKEDAFFRDPARSQREEEAAQIRQSLSRPGNPRRVPLQSGVLRPSGTSFISGDKLRQLQRSRPPSAWISWQRRRIAKLNVAASLG
ncbi:hypothetical protein MRX96_003691 [Rhipicephalus microplus]